MGTLISGIAKGAGALSGVDFGGGGGGGGGGGAAFNPSAPSITGNNIGNFGGGTGYF